MRELFAVQKEARKKADGRMGYAYFLEQGLGKTGTAITEFKDLHKAKKVDLLFVACPNSLKKTWEEEVSIWTEFQAKSWPAFDPRKSTDKPQVFIMNYEALISSGFEAALKFLQSGRAMIVLDESTRIKSHTAQTTKKALLLAKYAPIRRILTGTPMSQNVMDLWPQLRFIGELEGVNPYAFRNHFAVLGGYMGKQIVGFKNESELHQLLDSCSFRALKSDWLKDLPEKMPPVTRDVVMSAEQQLVYNEMKEDFYTLLNKKTEISADQVITQMERLSQIGRGFLYDENHQAIELVKPESNPCIKELMSILEQTPGKVIIFTVHQYVTDLLRRVLPDAAFIISEKHMKPLNTTADEQKKRFNEDKRCRHIICQLSVASMGHTLLGGPGVDRCSTTVFFENSYKLLDRQQAEDRCHRIGQDRGCNYFDISSSPIDRKVIAALQRKDQIAKAIVDAVKAEHKD